MSNEIAKIDPKEFGLEESNVLTIEQAFAPKIIEREALSEIYESVIKKELTPELCKESKECRLKLVKVRTGIADIHKTQKAFFLSAGRFVDAWKNKETLPIEQMEEKLLEIEKHFERIEAERIAKIKAERLEILLSYEAVEPSDLGNMEQPVFDAYVVGVKIAFEAKKQAEKYAEEKRIAEEKAKEEEDARIRAENARLKAESDAKEKALAIEREKAESDRKAKDAEMLKQRQDAEAKQKAIEDAARIEREKAEAENRRLAKELQDRKDAELKAENDRKEKEAKELKEKHDAELKAAKAPKKQKLTNWINELSITAPIGLENDETSKNIIAKFEAFKSWAKSQVETI